VEWDEIQVFLAAFHAGSTAGAARKLGLHQSTVSRRLSALEDELGFRLFDRVPEGLVPTTAALDAIASAEAMRDAAQRFTMELQDRDQRIAGTVRVAVFTELTRALIIPKLPELVRAHPGLSIELVESTGVSDLTRREADIAIRLVPPQSGDLVYKRVSSFGFGVYVSKASCGFDPSRPPPLDALRWIRWDESLSFLAEARWQRQIAPAAEVVLTCADQGTILAAVEAGLGAAVLPVPLARLHPSLVEIHSQSAPDLRQAVYLVAHRALRHLPRYDVIWSFLAALLAEASDMRVSPTFG
jgi:DNA-binding transcriptional LysR family regulator